MAASNHPCADCGTCQGLWQPHTFAKSCRAFCHTQGCCCLTLLQRKAVGRGCVSAPHDLCVILVLWWHWLCKAILGFAVLSLCSALCAAMSRGEAGHRAGHSNFLMSLLHPWQSPLRAPLLVFGLCSWMPTAPLRWCTTFLSPASSGAKSTPAWDIFYGHIFGFRDQELPSSNALKCMHNLKHSVPLEVSRTFHTVKCFPGMVSAWAWILPFLLPQD